MWHSRVALYNQLMNQIGTLGEKSLHAALKDWLAQPGDQFEVRVENYVIDIVRGDLLIEIQTRNFSAMKRKLTHLTKNHRVHLIHPIPQTKWIVRQTGDGDVLGRRKSPRRGRFEHVFSELVRIPGLMAHPNFSLEVLLTHEEEVRRDDGQGSWRRKGWSIHDRRLLEVVDRRSWQKPEDLLTFLPDDLPDPFTNKQLAAALKLPARLAGRMTYCMRKMDILTEVGKQGNALLLSKQG